MFFETSTKIGRRRSHCFVLLHVCVCGVWFVCVCVCVCGVWCVCECVFVCGVWCACVCVVCVWMCVCGVCVCVYLSVWTFQLVDLDATWYKDNATGRPYNAIVFNFLLLARRSHCSDLAGRCGFRFSAGTRDDFCSLQKPSIPAVESTQPCV